MVNYRESTGLYAVCGINYGHESPRRSVNFVTRKITKAVARIKAGLQEDVALGNLNGKRDWGHSKDFVACKWLLLQQDEPQDAIIASGETHTVRDFVVAAFNEVGITINWSGEGTEEVGTDEATGRVLVRVNPKFFRAVEPHMMTGNTTRAEKMGWKRTYTFDVMVAEMVRHDLAEAEAGKESS